ncbi:MAG: hypothetical protein ACK5P5_12085 [Pseudobdellovibrionaceae bacterium]
MPNQSGTDSYVEQGPAAPTESLQDLLAEEIKEETLTFREPIGVSIEQPITEQPITAQPIAQPIANELDQLDVPDFGSSQNNFVSTSVESAEPIFQQDSQTQEKSPQLVVHQQQNSNVFMDLNSMNDFTNSNEVSLPLRYDLIISGIDTESEVDIIRDAMTDQRLGLNRNEIIEAMQNGQARIINLNPVKAAILFQRLRFEPFSIEVIEKKI